MPIRKAIVLSMLCLAVFICHMDLCAQDPVFRKYTEEEGLPGNDVYDVLVDEEGIMWFATDQGVSTFDSHSFTSFNINSGLPSNTIIKLYLDNFGRIWFLAYDGMLSYYEDKRIIPFEYNDTILKHYSDNYFDNILIDTSGGILLSPRRGGYAYISGDGSFIARKDLIPCYNDSCFLSFTDRGDEYFQTISKKKPDGCTDHGKLYFLNDTYYLKIVYSHRDFQRNYLKVAEGEYIVSYGNQLFHIRDFMVLAERTFKEEILALFMDPRGKLWVSIKFDHGIYMFEKHNLKKEGRRFMDGYTITSIIQDKEGNFWLGTEGHGVFFLPTFDFNLYSLPWDSRNLNVLAMKISGDRMWFSTRDKNIYGGWLKNGKLSKVRQLEIEEPYDQIKHIEVDSDGYLWLSSTPSLRYDPAGFPRPLDTAINTSFLRRCWGDTILFGTLNLGAYYDGELTNLTNQDSIRRIYSAYNDGSGRIWMGTLYGLYVYENGRVQFKCQRSSFLAERINCIDQLGDMLVVGTAAHGLLFLRGDSVAFHLDQEMGLLGNTVKSIFVQNDSSLIAGTKTGLNMIKYRDHLGDFEINSFGLDDGLPANEVNEIDMHDGYVWLATSSGLVSFDPNSLIPHLAPPRIQITGIQIGGRDTSLLDHYTLAYDQNDIRINFRGLSYRSNEGIRYRYQLSNYNDKIIYTRNDYADFPNLPPGDYTFFVNAGNIHGVWNDRPKSFQFTIRKHFTQTVLFIIFLILASSALLVLISMYFQQQKKIKENAKIELARLEQRLFRLQMNPHFVFNALLAIQGFMYMNKPREAGRYLTSFAKLIRHTLYGSSEEYLSLEKEIEALTYYLELQRLRFDEAFDFSIEIADDIIPESIEIPPLMIQPFLENAIEHGLQHLEEKGMLALRVNLREECLYVEVEDNGIGREQSMNLRKKKSKLHKSMGIEIMNRRVESLNRIMQKKIHMEIVDLLDRDGKSNGTMVKLCLPFRSA